MTELTAVVAAVVTLLGAAVAAVVAISKRARNGNGHGARSLPSPAPPRPSPPPPLPTPADGSGRYSAIPGPPDERTVHRLAELETQNRFIVGHLERFEERQGKNTEAIATCNANIEAVRTDVYELGQAIARRLDRFEDRMNQDRARDPRRSPRGGRHGPGD